MFAAIAAFTLVGMLVVMFESRYDRGDNNVLPRVKLDKYDAFKKRIGTDGEVKPSTIARQLRPVSRRVRGSPNHSVLWFFKRMGKYTLSPVMWYSNIY